MDLKSILKNSTERNQFEPEETLYVGDMIHDILTGKLAGVKTAVV